MLLNHLGSNSKVLDLLQSKATIRPLYKPIQPSTDIPLTQHHIVERHGLKTAGELAQWLQQVNEILSHKHDKDWKRTLKGRNLLVVEKALAKARKGSFFLGLDHTWLSWDT
jgi:5-methylcytosine-specific restriction endonuclease McrA